MSKTASNLLRGIAANMNTPPAHRLRRNLFTLDEPRDAIAYMAVRGPADENGQYYPEHIGVILTSIIYTHKRNRELFGSVRFEELLKRHYWSTTESGRAQIRGFLDTNIEDYPKKFARALNHCFSRVSEMPGFNNLDYYALACDLERWDDDNSVRLRWARTITSVDSTTDI